nr:penicillin-binding protein [Fusobacteriaceae bacterium]
FKPFVYFTALEKGYEMSSMIEDKPVTYGNWSPRNYGNKYSNMPVSLLQALDKSLNSVTVQLMNAVGPDAVIDRARKAGFTSDIPKELSISLGTMSVSPLELARAYAPFANGGYKIKPSSIIKVTDRFDKVIYENKEEKEHVFSTQNVALINYMLQSVVNNGTGRAARVYYGKGQVAVGGKTGTTNESRSVWFAGFTPDTVTTIYIGYDDNKPMESSATGGGSVAPIFGKYYNNMIAKGIYKPTISFSFVGNVGPSNDLISTEMIDPLTGLPIEGTSTSGAAIKRENMPAEYSNTYEEGLEGFFDDTSSESKPKAQPVENKEKTDKKKKEDIDSTLDEIFSEN